MDYSAIRKDAIKQSFDSKTHVDSSLYARWHTCTLKDNIDLTNVVHLANLCSSILRNLEVLVDILPSLHGHRVAVVCKAILHGKVQSSRVNVCDYHLLSSFQLCNRSA